MKGTETDQRPKKIKLLEKEKYILNHQFNLSLGSQSSMENTVFDCFSAVTLCALDTVYSLLCSFILSRAQ